MKQRDYRIDLLRAFACIMVLFCHAPQHYSGQGGKFLVGIDNYFGMAWGPILFFVISGACILNSQTDAITFLKKRLSRVLVPTVLWSIIYIFVEHSVWNSLPVVECFDCIPRILISPQYGLMWFMYALLGIYLLAPIISKWLANSTQKELLFYLILWSCVLIIPYLNAFGIDASPLLFDNNVFYYFGGFLWYAVAGYYCNQYVKINNFNVTILLISAVILISPVYVFLIKHFTGARLDYYACVFPMMTTLFGFVFWKNVKLPGWTGRGLIKQSIESISKLSFGIYLIHMLFMYPFRLWIAQFNLNYAIQLPLTVLIIGVMSYVTSRIISKLPFGKYIIG